MRDYAKKKYDRRIDDYVEYRGSNPWPGAFLQGLCFVVAILTVWWFILIVLPVIIGG